MKMRKVFTFIGVIILSWGASANEQNKTLSGKEMAKCYVEFLGGQRAIQYLTVDKQQLANLPKLLEGPAVRAVGVEGKVVVHKVYECVLSDANFKAGRARYLEDLQAK